MLSGEESGHDIFMQERKPRASSRSVADIFLACLVCLIPLDVGVRRVQLDMYIIKGWLGLRRRKGASGATLSALLRRKERIKFIPEREKDTKPLTTVPLDYKPVDTERRPVPGKQKVIETEREEKKEARPASTTERLLAKKRKWKKEE